MQELTQMKTHASIILSIQDSLLLRDPTFSKTFPELPWNCVDTFIHSLDLTISSWLSHVQAGAVCGQVPQGDAADADSAGVLRQELPEGAGG